LKLKKEHLVFLALAGVLILGGYGCWNFLFRPLGKEVAEARATLEAEKAKLEDAKAKAAQYEKFQAEAENVRRGLLFLNSRLDAHLTQQEEIGLFSGLGEVASLYNYTVTMNKTEASKEGAGLSQVPVTIKFDSSYHEVGLFLNKAVGSQRLLYPRNMHFVSKDTTGRTQSISSTIDLWLLLNSK
jgi:Tfp pilus assembly protein PilO